jgi:hypothetical protein
MALIITTPIAYNTGGSISGTQQIGDLAVGVSGQDYGAEPGGVTWWMGPNEQNGYVIGVPVSSNTQPTPISGVNASVGFYQSTALTDSSFVELTNTVFGQTFSSATQASIWLTNNGYWNTYILPVLSLDAGDSASYPGSGTTWTDTIGGKIFNLNNGPVYGSAFGGILNFNASLGQYAQCNTSLPDLATWSVGVWHYYTGNNVGSGMCIVTEVFPGLNSNINYSLGDNYSSPLSTGFFNGGWRVTAGYNLTPNNWYYIVGTYDGSFIKLYVNNTLVETNSYVGSPISSGGGIRLMRRWDNPDYWDGLLSTVSIYDKPLSQGQITSIWNLTKSRYGL